MNPPIILARPEKSVAYTAAQIATAARISKQTVLKSLAGIAAAENFIVRGNETSAWTFDLLPPRLKEIVAECASRNGMDIANYLDAFVNPWQPAVALADVSASCLDDVKKLRSALLPALQRMDSPMFTPAEKVRLGLQDYECAVGHAITERHWRRQIDRTLRRDAGAEDFQKLEIYLPEKPACNAAANRLLPAEMDFKNITDLIQRFTNPTTPTRAEIAVLWAQTFQLYQSASATRREQRALRRALLKFLFRHAPWLAKNRNALRVSFDYKFAKWTENGSTAYALLDGRELKRGKKCVPEIPKVDIDRLRHSASQKNGGRVDAAWREEYHQLSESLQQRFPSSFKAPRAIHEALNRKKIDALTARNQGKTKLRRMFTGVRRDWNGIPSMHSWVVDDMTSNLEVAIENNDGTTSLIQPQIIAVMDSASRKFVGWSISDAKAPNAGIVCDAVLAAFKMHGVPHKLGVENGFVFGKSLLVNGKEDDLGRTLVIGLGQFGCIVHHFDPNNPTSKSELEYGFHQIQCLMERHPGYGGRSQILNAPEDFKREQRLIRAGKVEATQFRYTFNEFIAVTNRLILKYNATPQQGRLKGLSPDESFEAGKDANDPPIKFTAKMEWLLNERQIVKVGVGGVRFTHFSTRRKIHVSGGQLVNFVGEELWAVMDRQDASMVTFMNKNFTTTFTLEVSETPSARESSFAPGSGVLAKERAKIHEHQRAISTEHNRLKNQFGDPRRELLAQIRTQSDNDNALQNAGSSPAQRITIVPRKMVEAGEQMQEQRGEILFAREQKTRRNAANKNKARRMEIPTVLVDDDEQSQRGLELLGESSRAADGEIEVAGEIEP